MARLKLLLRKTERCGWEQSEWVYRQCEVNSNELSVLWSDCWRVYGAVEIAPDTMEGANLQRTTAPCCSGAAPTLPEEPATSA
jgi:hypothetical protein